MSDDLALNGHDHQNSAIGGDDNSMIAA